MATRANGTRDRLNLGPPHAHGRSGVVELVIRQNGIYNEEALANRNREMAEGRVVQGSHPLCQVVYRMLQLVTTWLAAFRPQAVGDGERPPAEAARTRLVLQILSTSCEEPFAFHLRGNTFVIVTPHDNLHFNGNDVHVGAMREILMTLPRYEGELGGRALTHGVLQFGYMFHDKNDHDTITLADVNEWYAQTLARLTNLMPNQEDDAESVPGREEGAGSEVSDDEPEEEESQRQAAAAAPGGVAQGVAVPVFPPGAVGDPAYELNADAMAVARAAARAGPGVVEAPLVGGAVRELLRGEAAAYAARMIGIFPPLGPRPLSLPAVQRGLKRTRRMAVMAQKLWEEDLERVIQRARVAAEE
jgi:hypothetical protein